MNPSDLPFATAPHGVPPSLGALIFSDPLLLLTFALPVLVFVPVVAYRIWAWRRIGQTTRNSTAFMDETRATNAANWETTQAMWRRSEERSDRMIVLLTEIRDHLASRPPPG